MIKILDYFKVPHPLKRGKEVVVVDEDRYEEGLAECRDIIQKKKEEVSIFRFFIKAEGKAEEKDIEDVRNFEKKFKEKKREQVNRQKLGMWISFGVSLIIGYVFYLSFCGLHFDFLTFPVQWIYATFFNMPPDKWVVWTIIVLCPVGAIFRIFLPIRIPKIGKFGNLGILYQLKKCSEVLKVFEFFGKNRQRMIKFKISNYISELKNNSGLSPDLIGKIENTFKAVLKVNESSPLSSWNRSVDELLEELTLLSEKGEFPWPEIRKLSFLKRELISWGLTNFEAGKLKIVSPESSSVPGEIFSEYSTGKIALDLGMEERFAAEKANNLKNLLGETENLREKIYRDWEKFEKLEEGEEKIGLLRKLVSNLEVLTVISSHYHFGENPNVPQEKRKGALVSFYNSFYQKLGVGCVPSKEKTPKTRISLKEKKTSGITKFSLWLSESTLRGLAMTLMMVFLVASSFSFYTLNQHQVSCEKEIVFGTTDTHTLENQVFGERMVFKEYGEGIFQIFGHDIFWYLPDPIVKPRVVDFAKEQKCDVYHIVAVSNVPTNFSDQLKRFGQGNYGKTAYEGIKFILIFTPKTKDWVGYDFDGKGNLRLSRDLGTLFQSWQSLERENFFPQNEEETDYVFDVYLTDLAKKGELAKYIESTLQEQFTQGLSYGTSLDNVRSVCNFLAQKVDSDIKEVKNSNLSEAQKAEKIKGLELVKENLKKTLDDYEQEFAKEKADIINNPELLKKLLEGIRGREDLSLLLKEFPNLEAQIVNYVYYSYASDKFLAAVSGELGKETQEKMMESLKNYLASQQISEIVEIKKAEAEKFLMTMYDYSVRIQQPMELLNE